MPKYRIKERYRTQREQESIVTARNIREARESYEDGGAKDSEVVCDIEIDPWIWGKSEVVSVEEIKDV